MNSDHDDLKDISQKPTGIYRGLQAPLPEDKVLTELLAKARLHVMTPQEEQAQRRSWALGELMLQYPDMTRAEAVQIVDKALVNYDPEWRGIFKLVEEVGELLQVLGKLGAFPTGEHPDGGPPLRDRLEAELADVQAAIEYFRVENKLKRLPERTEGKLKRFFGWVLTGVRG